MTWCPPRPWDFGITHFDRLITPSTREPLAIDYVMEKVLRVSNDGADEDFIAALITVARETFEADTLRAAMPQTRALTLSGFPAGAIELPRPPLIEDSITIDYYDAAEDLQTLVGSPAEFLVIPSGEYVPGRVLPLSGASWPSTAARPDAVTVTYDCGYPLTSPGNKPTVPQRFLAGMCLLISELYKQRSLSVAGTLTQNSTVQLERFWKRVW